MRILLHDDMPAYLCHGGMQVQAQRIFEALRELGVDVEYARWWDPNQKCDLIHQFGVSPLIVNLAHNSGVKVVQTHILQTLANCDSLKRFYHATRNNIVLNWMPQGVAQLFPWHCVRENDGVIYINELERETAIQVYGVRRSRTGVIPHGCTPEQIALLHQGSRRRRSHLISVATITPRKNTVLLARAARQAGVPVVFLGKPFHAENDYYREFLECVDQKTVIYPGYVTEQEKLNLLTESSGFVLASQAESGCIAVYEAAAAGLPLLLPDRPWTRDYGSSPAIQRVPLNDEASLAKALCGFFDQAQRSEQPTFPILSWQQVAKEYIKVYRKVLSRP